MWERAFQKYLETFEYIFIEYIVPLSAYAALFIALSLLLVFIAKRALRAEDKELHQKWVAIKLDADHYVATLPDRQTLEQEFLLRTVQLSDTEVVNYQAKFDQIIDALGDALTRYAKELAKPEITSESRSYAINKSSKHYQAIVIAFHASKTNLESLWNEIADPSLPITQPLPTKVASKQIGTINSSKSVATAQRLDDPIIKNDTFRADVVNSLFLRNVYRKPFNHD